MDKKAITGEVAERFRRMLENGEARQQVAGVIGVDVKTIYKYLPAVMTP
ncbi:TPA: DNA-invertase, partial [Pseudomonas aeruginosa]|nr:DNA-invertase [Pseudomonas aeruginosa]